MDAFQPGCVFRFEKLHATRNQKFNRNETYPYDVVKVVSAHLNIDVEQIVPLLRKLLGSLPT